jgi:hypothetical protein
MPWADFEPAVEEFGTLVRGATLVSSVIMLVTMKLILRERGMKLFIRVVWLKVRPSVILNRRS